MAEPSEIASHKFEPLSSKVIAACIDVQRQLGARCKEVEYQRALELALPKFGVQFEREVEIPIQYEGVIVAKPRVDFRTWDEQDELLLETKVVPWLRYAENEQSLRYLTKGNYCTILLINFRQKPLGIRRFVNTQNAK